MLLGEYRHNLDPKNRVAIPAKFRSEFGGRIVVTRGIDRCLFIYDLKEWNKLVDKLNNLPITQANSRAFVRLMLSGAFDTELDSQGRIVVPDYLKDYAGLEREVVLTGLNTRVEIWGASQWDEYRKKTEEESESITEKLSELHLM